MVQGLIVTEPSCPRTKFSSHSSSSPCSQPLFQESVPLSSPLAARKENAYRLEVRRFLRANASTLFATGSEWLLVTLLVQDGLSYLIAAGVGSLLGAVLDFWLKRKWAFLRRSTASLHRESMRYVSVSALSLGWNLAVAFVLVHWLHMHPIPGVIAASVVVGALWNYPLHRMFVFPDAHWRRPGAAHEPNVTSETA